jgi:hypothetical protein
MDGDEMGVAHCAFSDSIEKLQNAWGGVLCAQHEITDGNLCHMYDCDRSKVAANHTCAIYQNCWHQHTIKHGWQSLLGICQLIRHSEDASSESRSDNYFVRSCVYCVETLCTPCDDVYAWTLFDKPESPINIQNFLDAVCPIPDVRPDYICVDKGCMILHTAITNGSQNIWKETTWFIVDSYHYINHHASNYLCHKWCNPAHNLVVVKHWC